MYATLNRDLQYAGIACVRELATMGPLNIAALRSRGVPSLILNALEIFGNMDLEFRKQAETALRYLAQ